MLQHFDGSQPEQPTHFGTANQSNFYGLATNQADAPRPPGWETRIACDPCREEDTVCKPSQSADEQTVRRDNIDYIICNACLAREESSKRLDSDNNVVYEEGGFHPRRCEFGKTRALQLAANKQKATAKARDTRALKRKTQAEQSILTWVGDESTGGPY